MWRCAGVTGVFVIALLLTIDGVSIGEDEPAGPAKEVLASTKWKVLHSPGRFARKSIPIPKEYPLAPLPDLILTGPRPAHPFVLGNFAADGEWKIEGGWVQLASGKSAALQLAFADQFELEGTIEQAGYGGWFMLLGWDQGRGFAIHNVMLLESGSPWFISSMRGGKAVEAGTREYPSLEWKGEQPFQLKVQESKVSLRVGKFTVFDQEPLEGYAPGAVVIGVYDTRYGPRPLRIKSLRIRAIEAKEE